jgi:hypothetical protein
MTLTSEQVQAVIGGEPVPIVPPEVGQECVMLRRDVFEQLRDASIAGDFDPARFYPLVGQIMAEDDANDPSLESYQKYKR